MTETMPAGAVRPAAAEHNPYLHPPYAPIHDEIEAGPLEVIGEVPADLDGVYLRNGPNPRFEPQGRYHWFDGDGMVHALRFHDGTASYRNRWVRTRAFELEGDAGRGLFTGVMEHPGGNPSVGLRLPLKDSANTDLVATDNGVLALWYLAGEPYRLDPLSLASEPAGLLPPGVQMSAHAKYDEATGEILFFDYGPVPPYMRYGVVGRDGQLAHLTDIDLPGPRLPHDMAITENHAVLMDLPLVNDEVAARQGRHKIVFRREWPTRFGVLPRHGDGAATRWFEFDPCYIYHSVNAWEEGDEIVLDVCRVTKPAPRSDAEGPLAKMLSYLRLDAQLHRYRMNLVTGATAEEALDDDNTEFPSIDVRRMGRPTRYTYNMHIAPDPTLFFDGIVRYDTHTGTSTRYDFGPGRWGSEAPFAPRTGSTGEDDGYLVSFVRDEREQRSEVVILDASDIAAGPVGRVILPHLVPIGFHATWARADQIGAAPA